MDIHEYQAKEILVGFGINVPKGGVAYSPEQAAYCANEIGGKGWAVKAQIHSGARGKAGGIKFCDTPHDVQDAAAELLGKNLVTHQTGPAGKLIHRVYVEEASSIKAEFYLAFVLDRKSERIMVVASASGGMDIEEVSEKNPDAVFRLSVEPAVGMQPFEAREVAFALGIEPPLIRQMVTTIQGCYRAFRDLDATMVEINPLIINSKDQIVALDAKMSFDSNALFRHPHLSELRDKSQEDPRETRATDGGLSYVGLEGNIGCMINGAGLAMATMDMILHAGGAPANFLDIGGGATPERVEKAFNLVLSDEGVESILINIFAGINRCDWVAEGVIEAVRKRAPDIPVIVRLSGTHVEEGRKMIEDSGLAILSATTLAEAADMAVASVKSKGS